MTQYGNRLFAFLGLSPSGSKALRAFADSTGISVDRLRYYNSQNKMPLGTDLTKILAASGKDEKQLRLHLGTTSFRLADSLAGFPDDPRTSSESGVDVTGRSLTSQFETQNGSLYRGDCLEILPGLPDERADVVFADPPFNLSKLYPSQIDDNLREADYIRWCEQWAEELVRILKWGGSFFLWNLPRWNTILSGVLERYLTFRNWIAVDIKYTLPLPKRLYPSHYSLLYYCKGPKPTTFNPDRLPMQICPKCMADLRDYGGYKNRMNPRGVNLTDVWYDLSPVRHRSRKRRVGANELPILLMDRIVEMASREGELVLDPFGGAGTTYAAAEIKGRKWIGIEIGPLDDIVNRLKNLHAERELLERARRDLNCLFRERHRAQRQQLGLWTDETFR